MKYTKLDYWLMLGALIFIIAFSTIIFVSSEAVYDFDSRTDGKGIRIYIHPDTNYSACMDLYNIIPDYNNVNQYKCLTDNQIQCQKVRGEPTHGVFYPDTKTIIICNPKYNEDGINILFHEYRHAYQIKKRLWTKFSNPNADGMDTYWDHPSEIDAREYASCMTSMFMTTAYPVQVLDEKCKRWLNGIKRQN